MESVHIPLPVLVKGTFFVYLWFGLNIVSNVTREEENGIYRFILLEVFLSVNYNEFPIKLLKLFWMFSSLIWKHSKSFLINVLFLH